jgi:hypothetical protein
MVFFEPVMHVNRRVKIRVNPKTGMWNGPRFRGYSFPHEYQRRYCSTQEAIAGHEQIVQIVQLVRNGPRKVKKHLRRRYDAQRSAHDKIGRRVARIMRRLGD